MIAFQPPGPVVKLEASIYLQRVGTVLAFASARQVDDGSDALLALQEVGLR